MNWLFSQALVAAYSVDTCSAGARFVRSSTSRTQQAFCAPDKITAFSRLSRFGMTCAPLTADRGEELLTWYLAGFPAKTSALQDVAQGLTASAVDCGEKWHELSVRYDLDSHSWRTHQCLFTEDLPPSSVTLPKWGTMRSGVLFQHRTLVRPIAVTEYGYSPQIPNNVNCWHTPTTGGLDGGSNSRRALKKRLIPNPTKSDGERGAMQNWQAVRPSGHKDTYSLVQFVQDNPTNFPTPTVCGNNNRKGLSKTSGDGLATFVKKFPTPQASDHRDRGNLSDRCVQRRIDLGKQISLSQSVSTESGQLNPTWVEWLMGWTLGWTDLKPLATGRFRSWQRSHGVF